MNAVAHDKTLSILRWIAPGLVGATAALLLAPLVGDARGGSEPEPAGQHDRARPARRDRDEDHAAVRRAVASIDAARARARDDSADDDEPSRIEEELALDDDVAEAPPVDESPEVVFEGLLQGRDRFAERLRSEPVDAAWAGEAQTSLQHDLEQIAAALPEDAAGFHVGDVECRSATCVAKLDWSSASAAVELGERVALGNFAEPCGIFVLGPSPDALASDAAFAQDVYFDCARSR